tara:strand:+ start:319 stop:795 length:477 start_codon:yes stop_codon:yes gene_type:complete
VDNNMKHQMLGQLGEAVVQNYLIDEGYKVKKSVNTFDHEKDFTVDGKFIEVKTQMPFFSESGFTIRPNQLKKCRSVDMLFFVAVPNTKGRFTDYYGGNVYQVDPKNARWRTRTVFYDKNTGVRTMKVLPIEQDAVKLVHKISDSLILKQMEELSVNDI